MQPYSPQYQRLYLPLNKNIKISIDGRNNDQKLQHTKSHEKTCHVAAPAGVPQIEHNDVTNLRRSIVVWNRSFYQRRWCSAVDVTIHEDLRRFPTTHLTDNLRVYPTGNTIRSPRWPEITSRITFPAVPGTLISRLPITAGTPHE